MSARRRRWPGGLLGMLALIAAVEGTLRRNDVSITTPWSSDWERTGHAARRKAPGCEVLCFGDSLVKFGLVPQVISERLGRRAYNLAPGVGQAPSTYFLLRRALEAGARPEVVLVDFKPSMLVDGPRINLHQWPLLATPREALDLAWTARDPALFAQLVLARYVPSVQSRWELRAQVAAALRGESASQRGLMVALWRNWKLNLGAQVMAPNPHVPEVVDPADPTLFPASWSGHPVNAAYLARFLDLARSRGIRVVWLIPPIHPSTLARREALGLDAAYTAVVRRVQARYPEVVVVDGRRASYPREVFVDAVHLDRRGATTFSTDVADTVAGLLRSGAPAAEPAWVDLPAFGDRPVRAEIEDLGQTFTALKERRRGVRR